MKQFVPLTDDMLYRADGALPMLVPYHCGIPCCHRARDESDHAIDAIEAEDRDWLSDARSACRQA